MASLNQVQLIGNLGQEPDIRSTQSGARVATLSLATNEKWTDKASGEKRERTEWHRVVVWGDGLVGIVEKFLNKGSRCFVSGKLQTRKWTDTTGADRYTTEIVVQGFGGQLILLDGRGGGDRPPPPNENDDGHQATSGGAGVGPADLDDDIPF